MDINETDLFELEQECKSHEKRLRMLIGDVRDKQRLARAMQGVDIVFHAAALKHVYINEYSPSEAIKTNVLGTENVIEAAIESNISKMVTISTDKAVNPTSVMGTTKLLAEKLTSAAQYNQGSGKTTFCSVRFGNVLASRGSVVPLFLDQIKKGGPVTVTDPKMTRFVMSTPKAIGLVLKASSLANGGEVFILEMPSLRISDLAEAMIEKYAPQYGHSSERIKVQIIGAKVGEKMHESLVTDFERPHVSLMSDGLLVLRPQIRSFGGLEHAEGGRSAKSNEPEKERPFNNSDGKLLTKQEIRKLLDEIM